MNQEAFTRHEIIDRQQQGLVAGIFAHPAGWSAESSVYWNYQNTNLPAVIYARVASPQGSETLEFLPLETFSWTEPEMGMYMRGQNVGGVVNLPPMSGVDALVHLITPKYRGNRPQMRIVAANAEPTVVQPPPQIPPQNVHAQNAVVRIEYAENGSMMTEEFHTKHILTQFPPFNNGFGMTYFTAWSLTDLCCFRALKEEFEAARDTFFEIRATFQTNPQWVQLANQFSQMSLQTSKQIGDDMIQSGWERLRMNGERIREDSARGWQYIERQQQRINESYNTPPASSGSNSNSERSEYGSHEAFIDSIYGRETVENPENSANTKVEGYHDHVWRDEFGNLVQSDDPNFDPNVGSHINWTRARKRKIGD